ncbi:MAG: carbohydrate ABC transporter permease, partial [Actinomycetes bacterium]
MLALVVLLPPLVLRIVGSLHPPGLPPPPALDLVPDGISGEAYSRAVELGGLVRATANSTLVALVAVPLSVLVASLAGFALVQLPRRVTTVVVLGSLVALTVPITALLVPRFTIFSTLGLTDTLLPLVAPALIGTSPLYVLVYVLAFRALSADLYDTCRLEDLTPMQTWR